MTELVGVIDEVTSNVVYGHLWERTEKYSEASFFKMSIFDIEEGQRVDLQPGRHCSFLNGHLLISKTIWTTHDMEQADAKAERLFKELWSRL